MLKLDTQRTASAVVCKWRMFTAACLLELVVGRERERWRERKGDAVGVQKRKEGILTGAIWSHLVLISS